MTYQAKHAEARLISWPLNVSMFWILFVTLVAVIISLGRLLLNLKAKTSGQKFMITCLCSERNQYKHEIARRKAEQNMIGVRLRQAIRLVTIEKDGVIRELENVKMDRDNNIRLRLLLIGEMETLKKETDDTYKLLEESKNQISLYKRQWEKEKTSHLDNINEKDGKIEVLNQQLIRARETIEQAIKKANHQNQCLQEERTTKEQLHKKLKSESERRIQISETARFAALEQLQAMKKDNDSLKSSHKELKQKIFNLEVEHNRLRRDIPQHQAKETSHDEAKNKIATLENLCSELTQALAAEKQACNSLKATFEADHAAQIDSILQEKRQLQKDLEHKEKEVSRLLSKKDEANTQTHEETSEPKKEVHDLYWQMSTKKILYDTAREALLAQLDNKEAVLVEMKRQSNDEIIQNELAEKDAKMEAKEHELEELRKYRVENNAEEVEQPSKMNDTGPQYLRRPVKCEFCEFYFEKNNRFFKIHVPNCRTEKHTGVTDPKLTKCRFCHDYYRFESTELFMDSHVSLCKYIQQSGQGHGPSKDTSSKAPNVEPPTEPSIPSKQFSSALKSSPNASQTLGSSSAPFMPNQRPGTLSSNSSVQAQQHSLNTQRGHSSVLLTPQPSASPSGPSGFGPANLHGSSASASPTQHHSSRPNFTPSSAILPVPSRGVQASHHSNTSATNFPPSQSSVVPSSVAQPGFGGGLRASRHSNIGPTNISSSQPNSVPSPKTHRTCSGGLQASRYRDTGSGSRTPGNMAESSDNQREE